MTEVMPPAECPICNRSALFVRWSGRLAVFRCEACDGLEFGHVCDRFADEKQPLLGLRA